MSCGEDECIDHADALQETIDDQADEIERLRKEVAEMRKLVEWQPIETAPSEHVLLYYPAETGRFPCDQLVAIGFGRAEFLRKPTHWMPLPKPPAVEGAPITKPASTTMVW